MRTPDSSGPELRRRRVLAGGVAAVGAGVIAGCTDDAGPASSSDDEGERTHVVEAEGDRQAGVDRPSVRQAHLSLLVGDVTHPADVRTLLARLGERILSLTDGSDRLLAGIDPAGLTVTVGVGPRIVRMHRGGEQPGAEDLPAFAREDIESRARGGDLMVQVCADDPTAVVLARQALEASAGKAFRPRWQVSAFRGDVDGVGARNLIGFYDGISVPTSKRERDTDVWIRGGAESDSTIAVVRLMRIDVNAFVRRPVKEQEHIVGRERASGVPLSGGTIETDPDLNAKSDTGEYDIAVDAHVRRAHPLPSGAGGLMLRRGYSYANGSGDQGLVFICFQNSLRMFTQTQERLDESDALLDFTTTTATGTFLILPGFDRRRPLGASL